MNANDNSEKWHRVQEVEAAARSLTRDIGFQQDLVQEMLLTLYSLCTKDTELRRHYEAQLDGECIDDPDIQLRIARRRASHYLRDKLLDGAQSGSVVVVLTPHQITRIQDREMSSV